MYYIFGTIPNLTSIHFFLAVPEKGFHSKRTCREHLYKAGFSRLEIRKQGFAFFKWEGKPPDWFEVPRSWEGAY